MLLYNQLYYIYSLGLMKAKGTFILPEAGCFFLIVATLHCFSPTSFTTVKIVPRQ